jgi:hypothetical protein
MKHKIAHVAPLAQVSQVSQVSQVAELAPPDQLNFTAEILKAPYFINLVGENIEELRSKRNSRPAPPSGCHYKRDWYDRMTEVSQFNTTYFLSNIEAIWNKKSTLNRETRKIIQIVCNKALRDTLLHIAQSTPNSELPTPNSELPTPNSELPTPNSELPKK